MTAIVRHRDDRRVRGIALCLCLCVACTPAPAPPPAPVIAVEPTPAPNPPPKPDADARARRIVGARSWTLIDFRRLRSDGTGELLADMIVGGGVLHDGGLDPLRDFERAVVAVGPRADHEDVLVVLQHALSPDRIAGAMNRMLARREGSVRRDDLDVPTVLIRPRHGPPRVVLAPAPHLLVLASEDHAAAAAALDDSAGVPALPDGIAVRAEVVEPARTLRGLGPLPETLRHGVATLHFRFDGGAEVVFSGQSSDPAQAAADASALNAWLADATTIAIGPMHLRLFRDFAFAPQEDRVAARQALSPDQVELFIELMLALSRKVRSP